MRYKLVDILLTFCRILSVSTALSACSQRENTRNFPSDWLPKSMHKDDIIHLLLDDYTHITYYVFQISLIPKHKGKDKTSF